MKPGWPKWNPWLCGCSLSKGNQPPQHQNHPDKMLKLRSRGLYPSVELRQPLKLISFPAKGSAPALQGQEHSAPSPLPPCLSFPLVKGGGGLEKKETPSPPQPLLLLEAFLWLCRGADSSSMSLRAEQRGWAAALVVIHVSLYICLSVFSQQSAVTGRGVQRLWPSNVFCKGILSPEPAPARICALGERWDAGNQRGLRQFLGSCPHFGGSAMGLGVGGHRQCEQWGLQLL